MFSTRIIQTGIRMCDRSIASIENQLQNMPSITFGRHHRKGHQEEVLRYYTNSNGNRKKVEVSRASPRWNDLLPLAQRRARLEETLESLKKEKKALRDMLLGRSVGSSPITAPAAAPNKTSREEYSYDAWNKLQEAQNRNIANGYEHGRHLFRSKSELLIAELLEELGLEYKYEPVVKINGKTRWPDFAVYCPEINRYFFIEHLGRMDEANYRADNLAKMEAYEKAGIRNGIDIIYTVEFGEGFFNLDSVFGKLLGLVAAQSYSLTRNARA